MNQLIFELHRFYTGWEVKHNKKLYSVLLICVIVIGTILPYLFMLIPTIFWIGKMSHPINIPRHFSDCVNAQDTAPYKYQQVVPVVFFVFLTIKSIGILYEIRFLLFSS